MQFKHLSHKSRQVFKSGGVEAFCQWHCYETLLSKLTEDRGELAQNRTQRRHIIIRIGRFDRWVDVTQAKAPL